MLEVTVKHSASGIFSVATYGHAQYAEQGFDIVCAAVSTLMQALIVGLEDVLGIKDVKLVNVRDPDASFMSVEWRTSLDRTQQLATTIFLSLKGVEKSYPDFVMVNEVLEEDGY
jgi:uncharacterized protein YsxB (DUF464 family)